MDLTGSGDVEQALRLVGELLAAEGHEYAVIILGGAALNLLGIVERTTADVDILAFATLVPTQPLTKARCESLRSRCRSRWPERRLLWRATWNSTRTG